MLSRTIYKPHSNAPVLYWQVSDWYILSTKWTTLGSFFVKAYTYMTTLSAFLPEACGPWQCIHRHSTSKLHTVKEPRVDCENADWLDFSAVDRRLACNQRRPSTVFNDHINGALAWKKGTSHKVLSATQFEMSMWCRFACWVLSQCAAFRYFKGDLLCPYLQDVISGLRCPQNASVNFKLKITHK